MVKTTFKIVVFLMPILVCIGLLRRYFAPNSSFLPDVAILEEQFNAFPSMRDEVKTLVSFINRQWTFATNSAVMSEIWGAIEGVGDFFRAIGQTFVALFKTLGGFFSAVGGVIALVGAIITYPLQAIVWLLVVLGFGDVALA